MSHELLSCERLWLVDTHPVTVHVDPHVSGVSQGLPFCVLFFFDFVFVGEGLLTVGRVEFQWRGEQDGVGQASTVGPHLMDVTCTQGMNNHVIKMLTVHDCMCVLKSVHVIGF